MQRRDFLRAGPLVGAGLVSTASSSLYGAAPLPLRRPRPTAAPFKVSLKADAIGVDGSMEELIDLAAKWGYTAISVPPQKVDGIDAAARKILAQRAKDAGLSWGGSGLPVQFRESEDRFLQDVEALKRHAAQLAEIGVTRLATWIMPVHPELSYQANFEQHAARLRGVGEVLQQYGDMQLGLEYVGPETLRYSGKYTFLHSGAQLRELIDAIGTGNIGVILDSFHWYTAGETVDDLDAWTANDIVAVDLNDANAKLSRADQIDGVRELPGATGVIDLDAFLGKLHGLGYTGPVRSEPFNATLNAMDNELAARASVNALERVIASAVK